MEPEQKLKDAEFKFLCTVKSYHNLLFGKIKYMCTLTRTVLGLATGLQKQEGTSTWLTCLVV
jgi:hypothetical protein